MPLASLQSKSKKPHIFLAGAFLCCIYVTCETRKWGVSHETETSISLYSVFIADLAQLLFIFLFLALTSFLCPIFDLIVGES